MLLRHLLLLYYTAMEMMLLSIFTVFFFCEHFTEKRKHCHAAADHPLNNEWNLTTNFPLLFPNGLGQALGPKSSSSSSFTQSTSSCQSLMGHPFTPMSHSKFAQEDRNFKDNAARVGSGQHAGRSSLARSRARFYHIQYILHILQGTRWAN